MLSMTGYGAGQCSRSGKKVSVMASTVNRKQIDLRVSLPRELLFLEQEFREKLSQAIQRGAVTVLVEISNEDDDNAQTYLNMSLAKSTWANLQLLRNELGINEEPTFANLLAVPEIFSIDSPEIPEEELREIATKSLDKAIAGIVETRKKEGEALEKDLHQRRENLKLILGEIQRLAPTVPENYRARLISRIEELDPNLPLDEERILKEVLYFADRSDIAEETTRLASHLEQMLLLFRTDGPIGRKLDFLIQELVREINTVGSKASDKDIAVQVVEFKTELERIREQVQNIE